MNLTQECPRSPREKLVDLAHVPRMVDKARAAQQNTLGEYIFPCPLDQIILGFLGVDSDTFKKNPARILKKSYPHGSNQNAEIVLWEIKKRLTISS